VTTSPRDLEHDLVQWILDYIEEEEFTVDVEITADTDLVATGALDSMGFVGLVAKFENLTGAEVDFEEVDAEELTSVRALIDRCVPQASA
jgi:acyl carrier protein